MFSKKAVSVLEEPETLKRDLRDKFKKKFKKKKG